MFTRSSPTSTRRRALALGVAVTLAALSLAAGCRSSEPPSDDPAALAGSVTIYRDSWGVPHVYGPTDASVVFGFLFAQAEDNFWQIEDSMIQALGRAAEVRGEGALAADLLNRALEIPRLSQEEYERADERIQELCRAAAAGLNHYLASDREQPRLLEHFEPWHFMAFSRFAVYQLFVFNRAGIRPAEILDVVERIDVPAAAAMVRSTPPPPTEPVEPLERVESQADLAAAGQLAAGSNMWAVSPGRSESGHALLFINPHQPYFGPGQWYEGHVDSEAGLHMSGAGFFGSLFPTIGHNEFLGWSHTVNDPDIVDVYELTFDEVSTRPRYRYGDGHREAVSWTDKVMVKTDAGLEQREYRFTKSHHGPVLAKRDGKALAVRMAHFEEGGQIESRYAMARAQSLEEWKAAKASLAVPMFNTLYADREGNIYYVYNGAVPRRSSEYDWSKPVDGSDPGTEWQGYHALAELPQLTNPPAGYLQNCNATPFLATGGQGNLAPAAYPSYMAPEQDNARSRISRRILEQEERFSFEEWAAYAWDTTVIEAETWIQELRAAVDASRSRVHQPRHKDLEAAVRHLEAWDRVATVDSTEMSLFFTWRDLLFRAQSDADPDNDPPLAAFVSALDQLESTWGGWQVPWGEINRLQRRHSGGEEAFDDAAPSLPVAGGPGPVGIVFNFYTRPGPSGTKRYGVAGHSFVSVVEFGEKVQARSLLVFGESADPASPHWFDQAELFAKRTFKPAWFDRAEVLADAQRTYHPGE